MKSSLIALTLALVSLPALGKDAAFKVVPHREPHGHHQAPTEPHPAPLFP